MQLILAIFCYYENISDLTLNTDNLIRTISCSLLSFLQYRVCIVTWPMHGHRNSHFFMIGKLVIIKNWFQK